MSHFTISRPVRWLASVVLSFGLTLSLATILKAESPESVPVELRTLVNQINTAANKRDIKEVTVFYSPEFTTSDGLNLTTFSQSLTALWGRYPNAEYTTKLLSWEKQGDELVAETQTTITGSNSSDGRKVQLKSTIKSRQYFKDLKMVRQEILRERTDLTTGTNPPKVQVMLPETVRIGQEFDFDVIVQDPIGDSLLAGGVLQEKAEGERYLSPGNFELKLLSAGGLFKRGKATATPENHWLSALLINEQGMTLVTQRIRFEP